MADRSFGERVVAALAARGWSMREASRQTGVSYDVIRELHRRPGSSTSAENAQRLSDVLRLDDLGASDLVRVEPGEPGPANFTLVPAYAVSASAGHGSIPDEYEEITFSLAFPAGYLHHVTRSNPKDLAIISVVGDSMAPTLNHKDVVMIDLSKRSLGYDGLFVLRFDDALHVKRISRGKPGHVRIISDNKSNYPEIEYPMNDVVVVGKVLWSGCKVI